MIKNKKYRVLSLFSGCGGLDLGLEGGFNYLGEDYKKNRLSVVFANDINASACATYKLNLGLEPFHGDIETAIKNGEMPAEIDVVVGGFPCQPFSYAGKRLGTKDPRGTLYRSMLKVVAKAKPKVFLAENVKGLLDIDHGNVIKKIVKDFERIGYSVNYKLYSVSDFGVPQSRSRIIIVGLRKDFFNGKYFSHLNPSMRKTTVKEAIDDLASIREGMVNNHYWSKAKKTKGQGNISVSAGGLSPAIRAEHHGNIEFHYSEKRRLSAREAARIQSFPDTFKFATSTSAAYKQIGNAVPPVFAWHIAKQVQKELDAANR